MSRSGASSVARSTSTISARSGGSPLWERVSSSSSRERAARHSEIARARQLERDRASDTAAGAGDDRDAVLPARRMYSQQSFVTFLGADACANNRSHRLTIMNSQVFREYDIRGIVAERFRRRVRGRSRPRLRHAAASSGEENRHARPRLPPVVGPIARPAGRRSARRRHRPGRHRRGADAAALFFGAELEDGRRRDDYRQPQRGRVQRLQAGCRADDDSRRGDSAPARNNRAARFCHDRRERLAERASGDSRLQRFHHVAVQAHAGNEGRRRRRQRMRRRDRGAADEAARARHDRTLHRDGRALPEPSSGPDGRGEHARSDRGGERKITRRSESHTTATPTASVRWTRTARSSGATS